MELLLILDAGALTAEEEPSLWQRVNHSNKEIDKNASEQQGRDIEAEIIISSSISITADIVGGCSGGVLTSLAIALLVLSNFDPLPILREEKDKK